MYSEQLKEGLNIVRMFQVGFSRGLSFGSAGADFTLESLDPLKN